jgi:hypothetical protein
MCCRAWSARWRQLGGLRKGRLGASPSISSLCAAKLPKSCDDSLWPAANASDWPDHAALSESLLGDDPVAIIDALKAAAGAGASPADLGRALAYPRRQDGSVTHEETAYARASTYDDPSVWRNARRKTARSVSAVVIANAE